MGSDGWTAINAVILALGAVAAMVCLYFSLRAGRRVRLVKMLPTSKTTGVFIGLVEVKGTAEAEAPLRSYLSATPCVYYTWIVEEHWSRTVTETYRDKDGRTQTHTRRESGWTTVADGGEQTTFYLQDDCGVIRVNPDRAAVEPLTTMERTCTPSDPLYYGKGPSGAVSHSDHERRLVEHAIPLHTPLYVMGQARERDDVVAAEIAQSAAAPLFLISSRTENQVSRGMVLTFWLVGILGLLAAVGASFAEQAVMARQGGTPAIPCLIAAAGYFAIWCGGWIWMVYNSLIELRQRVRQAWSNVDVQLKRRADLIPNLAQAVEGYRSHETATQASLAELRGQLGITPPGEPGPDARACAPILAGLVERYPQLKADESFRRLHSSLTDTENRIALARSYYNEIATHYNTRLQIIPDRAIAALGSLRPQSLMTSDRFERAPVGVHLSDAAA